MKSKVDPDAYYAKMWPGGLVAGELRRGLGFWTDRESFVALPAASAGAGDGERAKAKGRQWLGQLRRGTGRSWLVRKPFPKAWREETAEAILMSPWPWYENRLEILHWRRAEHNAAPLAWDARKLWPATRFLRRPMTLRFLPGTAAALFLAGACGGFAAVMGYATSHYHAAPGYWYAKPPPELLKEKP